MVYLTCIMITQVYVRLLIFIPLNFEHGKITTNVKVVRLNEGNQRVIQHVVFCAHNSNNQVLNDFTIA